MAEVVSLEEKRSARQLDRRLFFCIACGSYNFKLIEIDGDDCIGCANCEAWISEFTLTRTRENI